jgi:hypothetical protein
MFKRIISANYWHDKITLRLDSHLKQEMRSDKELTVGN